MPFAKWLIEPIKYSIEDYAVVFSLKGTEQAPLYIRTYRIDPNTFYQGLEAVGALSFGNFQTGTGGSGGGGGGGGGGQNGQNSCTFPGPGIRGWSGSELWWRWWWRRRWWQRWRWWWWEWRWLGISSRGPTAWRQYKLAVRDFFNTMGVDLNPPKSVFFNDRSGILLVRATLQDLDVIEAAVQALNVAPPMINIKTRFAEISQNDAKALGFDWYFGNFLWETSPLACKVVMLLATHAANRREPNGSFSQLGQFAFRFGSTSHQRSAKSLHPSGSTTCRKCADIVQPYGPLDRPAVPYRHPCAGAACGRQFAERARTDHLEWSPGTGSGD